MYVPAVIEHATRRIQILGVTAEEELARIESKRTAAFEALLLPVNREAWLALVSELEVARCAFHEAARSDLGVRRRPQMISDVMGSWYPEPEIQQRQPEDHSPQ